MTNVEFVTTLKRKATRLIARVRRERRPILITQHGLPAVYLVDVESFERLQSRIAILEGIALGEKALQNGQVLSHAQAKVKMKRWVR